MRIGLHDSDDTGFPNYALMKISAWHKAQGDTVEWWNPMLDFDKVYSSKVFTFTPVNPYLPPNTIKGGTGYGIYNTLPDEIDNMFLDYSIYPKVDYAIGFLTRGCIRSCPWCVVPKKEGKIRPYRTWEEIKRPDSDKIVFMDNNVLACPHGVEQMREISVRGGYALTSIKGLTQGSSRRRLRKSWASSNGLSMCVLPVIRTKCCRSYWKRPS